MGPRAPKCNSCNECSMRTPRFRSIPAGDMLHDGMRKLDVERYRCCRHTDKSSGTSCLPSDYANFVRATADAAFMALETEPSMRMLCRHWARHSSQAGSGRSVRHDIFQKTAERGRNGGSAAGRGPGGAGRRMPRGKAGPHPGVSGGAHLSPLPLHLISIESSIRVFCVAWITCRAAPSRGTASLIISQDHSAIVFTGAHGS